MKPPAPSTFLSANAGALAPLRMAFVGDITDVSMSSRQRLDTLVGLGLSIRTLDGNLLRSKDIFSDKIAPRIFRLPASPANIRRYNAAVSALAAEPGPHVAWFEWPRLLTMETLSRLKEAWPDTLFVCFQDDNPFGLRKEARQWKLFHRTLPLFDVHFVKRAADVERFRRQGAQHTLLYLTGYFEPEFERTATAAPTRGVLFVGTALDHRIPFLEELVLRHHVPVEIYGGKWKRARRLTRLRQDLLHGPLANADYVHAIQSHKITLGFVSSTNLDEYSGRSFQIPAAGGLMLAERTATHQQLFREGVEADFFSSPEECAEKIRYYLANEPVRAAVARRGRERCLASRYGMRYRLGEALEQIVPLIRMPRP